jgi:hypothetical protein
MIFGRFQKKYNLITLFNFIFIYLGKERVLLFNFSQKRKIFKITHILNNIASSNLKNSYIQIRPFQSWQFQKNRLRLRLKFFF